MQDVAVAEAAVFVSLSWQIPTSRPAKMVCIRVHISSVIADD